jgi:IS605 OrfB family transposase
MLISHKIMISCSPDQGKQLDATTEQFKELFNYLCKIGWKMKRCSKFALQKEAYYSAREKFPELPAQYVIAGCMKASAAVNSAKTKQRKRTKENALRKEKGRKALKPVSCPQMRKARVISLDARLVTIGEQRAKVTLLGGRTEVNLKIYPYAKQFWQYRRKGCEIKEHKGKWYLYVCFEVPEAMQKEGEVLGVDRGVKNIAVCSNGKFFNSKKLSKVKARYHHNRRVLQSKGTKSAKKQLKLLSRRENRFVGDVNHCVSKEIVTMGYAVIGLEKLDTRKKKKLGKKFNKRLGNWSWSMLEEFIKYKGAIQGIKVLSVPSHYTSQACSKCLHVQQSNRIGAKFKCRKCGYELHSDLNAAKNIAYLAKNPEEKLTSGRKNSLEGILSKQGCRQPAKRKSNCFSNVGNLSSA